MIVVTVPRKDYLQGICIILLVVVLFFVPDWSRRIVGAGFIVLVMLFLSGTLLEWIVRALLLLIGLLFTLIFKLARYIYRQLTAKGGIDGDLTQDADL
jgi:cell division protein FtsW (lipid II flippase)